MLLYWLDVFNVKYIEVSSLKYSDFLIPVPRIPFLMLKIVKLSQGPLGLVPVVQVL